MKVKTDDRLAAMTRAELYQEWLDAYDLLAKARERGNESDVAKWLAYSRRVNATIIVRETEHPAQSAQLVN